MVGANTQQGKVGVWCVVCGVVCACVCVALPWLIHDVCIFGGGEWEGSGKGVGRELEQVTP